MTNQRYSTLTQITASNVKALGGAWMTRLPGPTNQTGVTMSDGRIFVATLNCTVTALDAKTGQILWVFELTERPARRGVAVGADLGFVLVAGTSGTITAINIESGRGMWTHTLTPDPAHGKPAVITAAPSYANGVLLVSISGGDFGRRGGISALDARTGKEMWRFYAIPARANQGMRHGRTMRCGGPAVVPSGALPPSIPSWDWSTSAPEMRTAIRRASWGSIRRSIQGRTRHMRATCDRARAVHRFGRGTRPQDGQPIAGTSSYAP